MRNPFIVGDGIYLRPIEAEDAPLHLPWVNDHSIVHSMKNHLPRNSEEHSRWLGAWQEDPTAFLLAVCLTESDALIGHTALFDINAINRTAVFELLIGDKAQWGKGYGTQATRMMVGHGFHTHNLNRITLTVHADNLGGIRAYQKVGFAEEGRLRQAIFKNGGYVDVLTMAVLRDGWKSIP